MLAALSRSLITMREFRAVSYIMLLAQIHRARVVTGGNLERGPTHCFKSAHHFEPMSFAGCSLHRYTECLF